MNAQDLYNVLVSQYSHLVCTICDLHKPCKKVRLCGNESEVGVIDFDKIESIEAQIAHRSPLPSVDALCASGSCLCFIEIKGWKKYLEYNTFDEREAMMKAESYNLEEKLKHSEDLCMRKLSVEDYGVIDKLFILVSDIDDTENGLDEILYNLNALAITSNNIYSICSRISQDVLGRKVNIEHYYTKCCKLDNLLLQIAIKHPRIVA